MVDMGQRPQRGVIVKRGVLSSAARMLDLVRLRAWERALEQRLSSTVDAFVRALPRLGIDENTLLLIFALIIGTGVGLAVIVFYRLIDLAQAASLTAVGRLTGIGSLAIVVVVAAGLALVRLMVRHAAGDSDGENVPDVMRAVAKRGGVIHAWPVAVKTAGAAFTIGTGGSVGAEGPVAVAGAALGSKIGRFFRSGPDRLRLLVACGAAAGISAAFNAPIAGVFFSLEKVIGSFGVSAFPPVLVASVIAAAISRAAFGDSPVIAIPREYGVGAPSELILYTLLGVATGLVAVLYTRMVYRSQDVLARIGGYWRRVAIAAVVVGGLDVVFKADLWGRGHESLSIDLIGERTGLFLIGLALAKVLATSATLSAVRAGGVFTPALFIGATTGGGMAALARDYLPNLGIVPEAYALVGMAGLVAGSTHAPLTAIMIVFEMTSDYALILPLMLCGAVAYITARRLYPESIYSEWLKRRGETIQAGRDVNVLERLRVGDHFNDEPDTIRETATVPEIMQAISRSTQIEFPVLDDAGRLRGMITYDDLRAVLTEPDRFGPLVLAGDLASEHHERVTPVETLLTALHKVAARGSHEIPVVSSRHHDELLGVIGRKEILAAYDRELLQER
jgi:CIC family chloride channel protein